MKIRIIVDKYEHQGLYKGSEHEAVYHEETHSYNFKNYGKLWALDVLEAIEVDLLEESDFPAPNEKLMDVINTDLKKEECRSSYCECEEGKCSGGKVDMRADEANKIKSKADSEKKIPIKSDGGSSTYYDIDIPAWLLYTLNERQKEGKCYIKTEELIECGFSNDFSFGTLFKSLVRAMSVKCGVGKAGNDIDYEVNKILYYAERIREQVKDTGGRCEKE